MCTKFADHDHDDGHGHGRSDDGGDGGDYHVEDMLPPALRTGGESTCVPHLGAESKCTLGESWWKNGTH